MAVRWDLLAGGPDIGQQFQQGYALGEQRREQRETRNALGTLAANPNDPAAMGALAQANPALGLQWRGQQIQERRVAQQDARTQLEARQEDIRAGAQIIRQVNPTDEAGWQQALTAARAAGVNIEGAPPSFNQEYVRSLISIADALEPARQEAVPGIQREVDYYRSIGRTDLAQQLLERHAEGPPIVASNGDSTFTVIPRSAINQPRSPAPASQGARPDEATLRAQADEAIRNGAPREQVEQRLQQMLQGGASPSGSQTFP
jgi:hypothetical protein